MKLVECVPNFSEGRDLSVVTAIRDQIAAVPGVSILHVTADASHNRSVITFVAPYEVAVDAAFAGIRAARDRIDLSTHSGVHPRVGAADVVPFIPLDGATMDDCVALARALGARVGEELEIPVYLYERAATRESRRNLADVRRGGFERLRDEIATNPERAPDYGPARVHPTFGAVVIGARPFLVAYNVYLGGAEHLAVAKDVARAVRASDGGLPAVKALGLEVDQQAQVSMNLVDVEQTSLVTAYDAVEREAQARGVDVTWSELIGLVPERALFETAARHLRLRQAPEEHVLERRILEARVREQTLPGYLAAVASGDPFPGGGSVAAYAGALGAALVAMVAKLTTGRARYADVEPAMLEAAREAEELSAELGRLAERDAEAYAAVTDAYKLPKESSGDLATRDAAIQVALLGAAEVPLRVTRLCVRMAALASDLVERGNQNAITDAGTAAVLAAAAARAAAYNVRVNVVALADPSTGTELDAEAAALADRAAEVADQVHDRVELALRASHGPPTPPASTPSARRR